MRHRLVSLRNGCMEWMSHHFEVIWLLMRCWHHSSVCDALQRNLFMNLFTPLRIQLSPLSRLKLFRWAVVIVCLFLLSFLRSFFIRGYKHLVYMHLWSWQKIRWPQQGSLVCRGHNGHCTNRSMDTPNLKCEKCWYFGCMEKLVCSKIHLQCIAAQCLWG